MATGGCDNPNDYEKFYNKTYFNTGPTFPWTQQRLREKGSTDMYRPQLRRIKPYVKTGDSVLDIGCALGAFLGEFSRKFGDAALKLSGMDVSDYALTFASATFPHIEFIKRDITQPLNNGITGTFNLVISRNLLEHLTDDARKMFYENLKKLLAPGGRAYLETPNFRGIPRYIDPSWFIHIAHQKQDYTDEVFSDELTNAGFIIEELDGLDVIVREKTYETHARFAALIDIPNVIVPQPLRKRFFRSLCAVVHL